MKQASNAVSRRMWQQLSRIAFWYLPVAVGATVVGVLRLIQDRTLWSWGVVALVMSVLVWFVVKSSVERALRVRLAPIFSERLGYHVHYEDAGYALARYLPQIDDWCRAAGIPYMSSFIPASSQIADGDWYDPAMASELMARLLTLLDSQTIEENLARLLRNDLRELQQCFSPAAGTVGGFGCSFDSATP